MNQRDRIIAYLKAYGSITLPDALAMTPAIYRLSERVRELEKQGYIIRHEREAGKTYERYTLMSVQPIKQVAEPVVLPPAFKEVIPPFTIEQAAQKLF